MDIFPLENFDPARAGLVKKHSRVGLWRSFAVADPTVGSSAVVRLAKKIVCPFAKHADLYKLAEKLDGIARKMNEGASDRVIDILGEGNLSKSYPKSLFKPVRMKFEDREFTAPAGAEEYLAIEYGDWRTPPAESDRTVHVIEAYRL